MLIQPMNIQNGGFGGTSPRAGLQLLQRRRDGGEGRKKGWRDGGAQAPTLGRISGHMLNESSANLKQFMSRQMRVLSSFTPGLGSSTCPASSPLLSVFRLPSPALRSLTFVPPAVCFPPPMFHFLSINCFRCFYRLPPPHTPCSCSSRHTSYPYFHASPPSTFSSGEAVR